MQGIRFDWCSDFLHNVFGCSYIFQKASFRYTFDAKILYGVQIKGATLYKTLGLLLCPPLILYRLMPGYTLSILVDKKNLHNYNQLNIISESL